MPSILKDCSGNFGIMSALIMVPLAAVAGLSVDFANALAAKNELQSAADAAALAAISDNSAGYKKAMSMTGDGEIVDAETDAKNLFSGEIDGNRPYTLTNVSANVSRSGVDLTSTITYSAEVPTSLLMVLGQSKITVSGTATAAYKTATYRDFYLLLDNTPSMGVAATPSDISTMVANTGDQCAFACHIVNNGVEDPNSYYNLAKQLGVTTRINVVAQATAALMDTATSARKVSNQFRMAVYTFGQKAEDTKLMEVANLTSDLKTAKNKASMIDLMSIPYQGYNNDQQTDFTLAMQNIAKVIGPAGTGASSTSPEKIVFFVSDGVNDSYKPVGCTKKLNGGRCQEPINPEACQALKDQGYKVAVLYTTYLPLPTNGWYNTWISPFQAEIASRMQSCASSGYFFEVSPSEGISQAMSALFMKIISSSRITS